MLKAMNVFNDKFRKMWSSSSSLFLIKNSPLPQVSNVFLMNGVVFDYGQLLLDQYKRILDKWILIKGVCEKEDPSSPLIINANQAIPIANQTLLVLQDFFPKFKAGEYSLRWIGSILLEEPSLVIF